MRLDANAAQHLYNAQQRAELRENAQALSCGPTVPVALSAYGTQMGSSGDPTVVSFPNTVTYTGGPFWSSGNTFTAPCDGVYQLSVEYTTDSYYACPVNIGSQDDVYVWFAESSYPLYNDTHHVGTYAWRGAMAADKRGQAAYTVELELNKGDVIQTMVSSDGNVPRCLWLANLSIARGSRLPK